MFSIVIEFFPEGDKTDVKEVHWLAVHSFFEYLYPDQFLCALKPYNGNGMQAKVYFRQKVPLGDSSQLVIDTTQATLVDCHEEETLLAVRTRVLTVPATSSPGLAQLVQDLQAWLKVRVNCWPEGSVVRLSVTACHEEVLTVALVRVDELLLKAAAETRPQPTQPPPIVQAPPVGVNDDAAASGRRPRKPLFPQAFQQTLPPPAPQQQQQPQQQPQQNVFNLTGSCRLTIEQSDLTTVSGVELVVAPTNASLSLKFGLAKALATSRARSLYTVEVECSKYLHTLETSLLPFGHAFLSEASQILFLVLPNERNPEKIHGLELGGSGGGGGGGRRQDFRDVMEETLVDLLRTLGQYASSKGYRTVAMPTLGSTLHLLTGDAWAEVLATAFARAAGRNLLGSLRELRVCCVTAESASTLARAVAAQNFGANSNSSASAVSTTPKAASSSLAAAAQAPVSSEVNPDDSCTICCEAFSAENPKTPFHCDKKGNCLCATCVAILNDSSQPSDGKCPHCFERFKPAVGNQPANGTMEVSKEQKPLHGYSSCGALVLTYNFPAGTHEGVPYKATTRVAYLPDNDEGQRILSRLQKAFEGRVVFSVGASATTGRQVAITWNTLHHKTNRDGGATKHGYPDSGYLQRISDELTGLGY